MRRKGIVDSGGSAAFGKAKKEREKGLSRRRGTHTTSKIWKDDNAKPKKPI